MLKKLLKYDLIWIDKFLMFYAIAPLVALGLEQFTNHMVNTRSQTIWTILDRIAVNVLISAVAALFITAFVRSMARFHQTCYKDASYLTHTLPVARGTVYTEKFLAGLISLLGTGIVAALCLLIASVPHDGWNKVFDLLRRSDVRLFVLLGALVVAMELAFMLLTAMLGFVLGQRAVKGKTWRSVLLAAVLYVTLSAIPLLITFAAIRFIPSIHEFYYNSDGFTSIRPFGPLNLNFAIIAGTYAVVNSLLFVIGRRLFCKGVNVE
ncbi:MAG: hypothetical protein IKN72_12575 [Clostridia bacterium]|nr:hypothetical protein [Clostridia bacterium]